MSEVLVCPKTNDPCPQAQLCWEANQPLDRAVDAVVRATGKPRPLAAKTLLGHLEVADRGLPQPLHPAVDEEGNGYICPQDTLDNPPKLRNIHITPEALLAGLRNIAETCLSQTITDLHSRRR